VKKLLLLGILFLNGLMVACSAILTTPESTITPIPPSLEPEWLTVLYPKPGQIVSTKEYNDAKRQTHSGSLSAPQIPSSVCIEIWAENLIEAGDDWELGDVISRTTMMVDGIQRKQGGEAYDGIVLNTLMDGEGNELARVGGPYSWCVSAPVDAGVHLVEISFEKSSGTNETFSWTFTIVDGPIPTRTPLPEASIVDWSGSLPEYIAGVYPFPGENVIRPLNLENRIDLDEVWSTLLVPDDEWRATFPTGSNQQPICFALRFDELQELGELPDSRDWPDRIHFEVDGIRAEDWLYPSNQHYYKDGWISAHCIEIPADVGKHTATLYIDPFDTDLFIYSWGFTIE